jgi:rhodanese-related sulfurtransferase
MRKFFGSFLTPPAIKERSSAYDLKQRLDWGEPALTIIDIRSRAEFNAAHIQGAINMPLDQLVSQAQGSLEYSRDIYIYSTTDDEAAEAAKQLRDAGYAYVAELQGGVAAWKAMGYPTESNQAVAV